MSGSQSGADYTALPVASSAVLTPTGRMSTAWYRFFQTLWNKTAYGVLNETTLATIHSAAGLAQSTANDAATGLTGLAADLAAEINRAAASEAALQASITILQNTVTSMETQIAGLQTSVTNINQRLTAAGIP